jgi:hypothetical protein
LNGNVIIDGRPYSVSKRAMLLIIEIIKCSPWLDASRQPTVELSIVGSSLSVRRTEYERITVE